MPLLYILLDLPAFLLGRPLLGIFTIYSSQANMFQELSMNAPNLYVFMSAVPSTPGTIVGLIIAALIVGCWIWFNARTKSDLNQSMILLMSLVSVALVPFVLPKMHDRYFYPADIFSLLAAFYMPGLWFLPILYQIISSLAYIVFLFNAPPSIDANCRCLKHADHWLPVWKQVQMRTPTISTRILTKNH